MTAADTEKTPMNKNSFCLICDASVGVSTRNSCLIFQQNVTTSDKPISHIIGFLLGLEVQEGLVHSVVVCKKCFKLVNEVDELQERLTEIQTEVKGNYNRTIRKYDGTLPVEEPTDNQKSVVVSPDNKAKVKQGPGRPRLKKPSAVEMKSSEADSFQSPTTKNTIDDDVTILYSDQKENKSGNEQQVVSEGVDDEEEDDDDGVEDGGDIDDEDYVPDLTELGTLQGEGTDVQIKVEVLEEDITDKVFAKKNTVKKKSMQPKPEMPALIPAMVVSRDAAVYTCLVCSADEKFIADAKGISHHLKECHNLRLYICDMCGQEFFKRSELTVHMDEHVNEDREFQCEVCHRIFSNLRLFRVHKRMHYPQNKNWTCDQCGKRYLSRNMLEEHMNVHTGNRPYICHCGKDFASKYTYKAHEKTHLERARPFACNKCPKTFLTQANLQQHDRTHSAVRNFMCQICGK